MLFCPLSITNSNQNSLCMQDTEAQTHGARDGTDKCVVDTTEGRGATKGNNSDHIIATCGFVKPSVQLFRRPKNNQKTKTSQKDLGTEKIAKGCK